jgi:hypothetical protein
MRKLLRRQKRDQATVRLACRVSRQPAGIFVESLNGDAEMTARGKGASRCGLGAYLDSSELVAEEDSAAVNIQFNGHKFIAYIMHFVD